MHASHNYNTCTDITVGISENATFWWFNSYTKRHLEAGFHPDPYRSTGELITFLQAAF